MTGFDKRNRPCDVHTERARSARKHLWQQIRAKNTIAQAARNVAAMLKAPALATAVA